MDPIQGASARILADLQQAAAGRPGSPVQAGREGGPTFAETLERALGEVSGLQTEAQDAIGAFVRGEPVELHRVMAAAEEAGLALEMLIQIRNKLTDAYRAVTQMHQ